MKPLKPSMKERKRYLLLKGKNLKQEVPKAIKDFIGVLGLAKTSLIWIKTKTNSSVLCINRKMLDSVRASFAVWPEKIEVIRVSGTLKSLEK